MPRSARQTNKTQTYHVMLRGNNRENIFIDDNDKYKIIDIIKEKKTDAGFYLYAYCVMDNHIHMVIKEGGDSISHIIKRIATSYAQYFNKKHKKIGHVFQDRFRSENIEDDSYLLVVIKYVHQNPVKAGIGTIEGYIWSSYKDYVSTKDGFVETNEILTIFSNNLGKALIEFKKYNMEILKEKSMDVCEEKEINQTNVKMVISEYLRTKELTKEHLKSSANRHVREELLELLANKSSLSLRGIAAELGLGRESVRKILASKEPSP